MAWQVGADRELKVSKRGTWDAAAAKRRVFAWAGWPDNPDPSKAKQAFLIYDSENTENMGAYKLPFADVVDGSLVAVNAGLRAAASRLPQTDIPSDAMKRAIAVKDAYMKKIQQMEKSDFSKKADSLTVRSRRIEGAFAEQFYNSNNIQNPWISEVYENDVIVNYSGRLYKVGYRDVGEKTIFDNRTDWKEVEAAYTEKGNLQMADFIFTKASRGLDGVMRWSAVVSKFAPDRQDDEITPEFYQDAAERVEKGEAPMPPLVASHIDDSRHKNALNPVPDEFVVGDTDAVYVDGNKPKAKGTFRNTSLGKDTFEAIRRDIKENRSDDERLRISMAFRPTADGVEKSENGINRFRKGMIRHFATTRVPIVEDTAILAAQTAKSGAMTMWDDAATYLKPDTLEQLKSDYERIMDDGEDPNQKGDLILKAKKDLNMKDMGSCIAQAIAEGMDRRQAIAKCLNMNYEEDKDYTEMDRGTGFFAKPAAAIKADLSVEDIIDLLDGALEEQMDKANQKPVDMMDNEEYMKMPMGECTKAYMADGMSEEDAKEKCNTARAQNMRKAAQKGDLDSVEEAIGDSEVQVVKAEEPEVEAPVNQESEGGPAKEPAQKADTNTDVNEPESPATESNEADEWVNLFKRAQHDPAMSRQEKTLIFNHALDKLGEIAKKSVTETEPTSEDMASMIQEAIQKAINPVLAQNEVLIAQIKDMQTEKGQANVPQPRQIQFADAAQKSESGIQGDTGGALTAAQVAEGSVRYSGPRY